MMVAASAPAPMRKHGIPQEAVVADPCNSSTTDATSSSTPSRNARIRELTTTTSSSFSSSRRSPSPRLASRSPALSRPGSKRSQSVDRIRTSALKLDPQTREFGNDAGTPEMSSNARVLCMTTRSLSVSFQGGSFFYQTTSKAKAGAPTPERRRTVTTPERKGSVGVGDGDMQQHVENTRQGDRHRWPASRTKQGDFLMRSSDCSLEKDQQMFAAVRSLQQSMVFEEGIRRVSFDGLVSSDVESASPRCNAMGWNNRGNSRGFSQDGNSRSQRLSELGMPTSPARGAKPQKKMFMASSISSPRSASSPLRRSVNSAMNSPSRMRVTSSVIGQSGPAPSILTFAAEVRRAKNGENKIEEAHLLRLLYNRHLQWWCVNARINAYLTMQKLVAEKILYKAWVALSELHDSVMIKKIKLHALTQNLKLFSIFREQMVYLEEWSRLDRDHSNSLLGAMDALKASTLRLPVVLGSKVDIQDLKETIGSSVDVMQAMGSSICSLLSKVEGLNSLVYELTKIAAQERALLTQARDLLSMVHMMHVKQCSLRGHIVLLKRTASEIQL